MSKLDFSDWFAVLGSAVAAGVLAGIGAAMGWFKGEKRDLYSKLILMEGEMKSWQDSHADHTTNLAVLKTCQENTEQRLNEISDTTRDTNQNLKELSQTVTQVLLAIQSKGH